MRDRIVQAGLHPRLLAVGEHAVAIGVIHRVLHVVDRVATGMPAQVAGQPADRRRRIRNKIIDIAILCRIRAWIIIKARNVVAAPDVL